MNAHSINRLEYLLKVVPELLNQFSETDFAFKNSANKWSKKEIVGHLIDSATNNHHRLVRAQYQDHPDISYDQNKWNEFGHWQKIEKQHVILLWSAYNQYLLELIKQITIPVSARMVKLGDEIVSIHFLIEDYIRHLQHHLKQVVSL